MKLQETVDKIIGCLVYSDESIPFVASDIQKATIAHIFAQYACDAVMDSSVAIEAFHTISEVSDDILPPQNPRTA